MTTTYKITSKQGVELGKYEAESHDSALEALARDAGYASRADIPAGVAPFAGIIEEFIDGERVRSWLID